MAKRARKPNGCFGILGHLLGKTPGDRTFFRSPWISGVIPGDFSEAIPGTERRPWWALPGHHHP